MTEKEKIQDFLSWMRKEVLSAESDSKKYESSYNSGFAYAIKRAERKARKIFIYDKEKNNEIE